MRKNKLYSVVLSVLIAFGLWLYVINSISPESDATYYNIPVVMDGEQVLNERGMMLTSSSEAFVTLHLSGNRSDLNKVNSANITVKADLSKIYEPGNRIPIEYTISYPGDVASNAFVEESRSSLYVTVEYRRNKEVPVQVNWIGTRSEDYLYDTESLTMDYPLITVMGPASVADLIHHAEIEVDLTDRVESMSESFRYTLCDEEGNPVDAQMIVTNVEEVRLDLKIRRIKEVTLVADVTYAAGASESNTTIEILPKTIRVSGSDAALAELGDTITLCALNLGEIEKSGETSYAIVLPEGITNLTGVDEATVNIRFSGLSTKEFIVENFLPINIPEGMDAEIINEKLTVKVRGATADINKLTPEDISITVDLANAEAGTATYKAIIVFPEEYQNVGALGVYTVSVTVQETE